MSEHFVNKSFTLDTEKDLWQTPKEIFSALDKEFDFDLDVCANKDNHLCIDYYTEETSALILEWNYFYRGATCFLNPPYSQTALFMERAAQQAKQHNITVVSLVNSNTDVKWFSDAVSTANEVRLLTGRVAFIKPDGGKSKGNTKGQCLIIWRGKCETPCNITLIDRDTLYQGE